MRVNDMYLCYVCHSMSDGLMYQQFNNIILLNEGASLFGRLRVWLKGSGGQLHFFGLLDGSPLGKDSHGGGCGSGAEPASC